MAKITVAQFRGLLERSENDNIPDLEATSFLDFANFFNYEAYLYSYAQNKEDFIVDQTISVLAGTDTYTITSGIESVQIFGTGLFLEGSENTLPYTQKRSQDNGFFIKDNTIVLTPEPASARTDTFSYVPEIDQLAIDADELVVDIKHSEYMKDAIKIIYYEWSNDNKEIGSRERIQDSFRRFMKQVQKKPKVFIY